jgi:hypothetical protein
MRLIVGRSAPIDGAYLTALPPLDHSAHMFYTPARQAAVLRLVSAEGVTPFELTIDCPVLM